MQSRIDIIGSNGPTGDHYRFLPNCYGDYKGYLDCTNCEWLEQCKNVTDDVDMLHNAIEKRTKIANDYMA